MNIASGLIAAGLVVMSLAAGPAGAASLLGGLITTGSDTGNGSGLISSNSNGSIGVGGSNGVAVNLGGLTGGSGSGGLLGGGRQMAVARTQVAAGGLDRGVAEDVLEDVQRDICIWAIRPGMPEVVTGEVGKAEILDDLIPVRRVPHGHGREFAAFRADQQPVAPCPS